jgi:hypothetical protein
MSAQIIKLSDRRKTRPTASSTAVDLPISVFAAYADIGLAIYLSMVDAAQQGLMTPRFLTILIGPELPKIR